MKFGEIKNMEIISVSDASKLGFVDSLYLDLNGHQVLGLRTRTGGIVTRYGAILLRDVKAVGRDAITVEDPSRVSDAAKYPELQGSADMAAIDGARIMTEDGAVVGTAADIDFDARTGAIERYILTPTIMDRLRGEEHWLPTAALRSISESLIVVQNDAVDRTS